ncbi:MAG TPA: homoserine dehydrogenase [Steroidobacteraceae bacterium]
MRIALAGCGVVGSAFVQLLQQEQKRLLKERSLRFDVSRVLVRRTDIERPVHLRPELFTSDVDEFLATDADIVVEVLSGVQPALRVVHTALARGARVVTANKAMLAVAGPALAQLAARTGGSLDFEAAVAAGIPIIRALRGRLPGTPVRNVRGILNGTTNYILNGIEAGASFEQALADAQRLGFAEADPTRDLDGSDARDKLAVLAWLAWGVSPDRLPVRQRGIYDAAPLVQAAASLDATVRLIAQCERIDGRLVSSVEPVLVRKDSDEGRVFAENNLVHVSFESGAPLHLTGPGAGGLATARSVLADVLQACEPLATDTASLCCEPDTEPRRWLVIVPEADSRTSETFAKHDIHVQPVAATNFLTAPCGWPQLAAALEALRGYGCTANYARVDIDA